MPDEKSARVEAARAKIAEGLQEYLVARLDILKEDDPEDWEEVVDGSTPYITGWAVAMEYTNGWLENNRKCASMCVVAADQSYALTVGLFTHASRTF